MQLEPSKSHANARPIDFARARALVEKKGRLIIAHAAWRRQKCGEGLGARAALGLAAPPAHLTEIAHPRAGDAGPERITPLGYQTAARKMPRVLSRLDRNDPRRLAANRYAHLVETLHAVKGNDPAGAAVTGRPSDGGAVTRTEIARALRKVEAAVNGWPVFKDGRIKRGAELEIMRPPRVPDGQMPIRAKAFLDMVVLEAFDMATILERHGWFANTRNRKHLNSKALELLDEIAEVLGYGRAVSR